MPLEKAVNNQAFYVSLERRCSGTDTPFPLVTYPVSACPRRSAWHVCWWPLYAYVFSVSSVHGLSCARSERQVCSIECSASDHAASRLQWHDITAPVRCDTVSHRQHLRQPLTAVYVQAAGPSLSFLSFLFPLLFWSCVSSRLVLPSARPARARTPVRPSFHRFCSTDRHGPPVQHHPDPAGLRVVRRHLRPPRLRAPRPRERSQQPRVRWRQV